MNCLGLVRECDPSAALNECLQHSVIAIYGYIKRIAAILALKRELPFVTKDETMEQLGGLIHRLHDPLSWESDVKPRMTEMRLGQG